MDGLDVCNRATHVMLQHNQLREIEDDIAANATMCRKYGDDFFTEGTARLAQTRAEKSQKLAEIEAQLADTNSSVRQGKQLLGALAENYGNMAPVRSLLLTRGHARAHARCTIVDVCVSAPASPLTL